MRMVSGTALGIGVTALAGAFGLLGAAVYRAAVVSPAVGSTPTLTFPVSGEDRERMAGGDTEASGFRPSLGDRPVGGSSAGASRGQSASSEVVEMAIQNDLFLPARTAPAERYRLPGDIVVVDEPDERDLPDFPDFRVHGTAQIGDVGLAIIRMAHRDDDRELPPRVLEVGESISGYMLMKVEDEHATVVGPAGTYRLPVSALPRAAPPRRSNSSNNDQRSNADQARQLEQLIQQLGGRANIQIDRNNGRTGGRGGRGGGGEVPVAYFEYGDLPALGGGVTFDPRPALFGAVRREAIGTSVRWNPSGTNPGGV